VVVNAQVAGIGQVVVADQAPQVLDRALDRE
jgi:hypothetical protein